MKGKKMDNISNKEVLANKEISANKEASANVEALVNNEHKEENSGCHCTTKHTPRSKAQQKQLQNRLSRMIGQLNGISRMLNENRYCGDILTQVAAVESALQNFGYIILQEHLETCVTEKIQNDEEGIMDEVIDLVKKLK